MSDTPTASPVVLGRWEKPGNLAAIAGLAANGQITIRPHELIRTTDGRVYHWTGTALEITSAPVHHGTVADVAALAGIYLLPSCTRGVHQGDTAYVTAAACEYRVTSGINATATWSACASIPTSASAIGADPSGTADAAVSAHNTATDSHADIRTAIARNADHSALSNVLPSPASQNHLTDDELEFFGTLPSTISDLMSNVEEVDADFVSISYNPSGGGGAVSEVDPDWPTSDYEFEEFGAGGLIAAALASGTPVVLATNGASIGGGELADLVDHATDDIYISGDVGTYVQLDFGGGRAVAPSYFAIRNNSYNYDPLRNWEWMGSNDLSTWDVLDARINDTTLDASSVWGGWEPNTGTGQYYRYIRLVRTGATGGGGASYIRIGEIDVFGSMIIGNPLPSWATCWVGDDTYMWPARQR